MLLVPLFALVTTEWIARGTLADNTQGNGFFQALSAHRTSFIIAYLLLVAVYVLVCCLFAHHTPAAIIVGLLGYVPAVVTYFKLTMRGEPFLPWDLTQIGDLMGVSDSVELSIQPSMVITLILYILIFVGVSFIRFPGKRGGWRGFWPRGIAAAVALAGGLVLMFAVFLSPSGTTAAGIKPDMWMQDRYYRTNGVLTGFLTNLQLLNIDAPDGYSGDAVLAIAENTEAAAETREPYYEDSYAAQMAETEQTPDIIFLMAESFWDVTALEGISYDQPLLTNFTALVDEGASGHAYTPSFGGGTCDVEFEALTGFSMEFLPAGSKPYQQYITDDVFALPHYLKSLGYSTTAVHGYGRRFWNRDTAYPRLGIDEFIASDDFVNPKKRRGFISDDAMVDQIIQEYEDKKDDGPVFIHAITMQNHTTYNRNRYPENELVRVTEAPAGIPDATIGQLEDCATGIREMDAALGKLTDYLRTTDRPTIVVFWGDHMNPMSDGFTLFEETGFIEKGDTASPRLYETPLLIWSNYADNQVDLGTLSTYNLSPVMMDLYGLKQPLMFEYLMQQLPATHGRSKGIVIEPDNTTSEEMTQEQQEWFNRYAILQYNYLFGGKTLEGYFD
ncbi:MAG: LTA synthase family protein [Ruminococcaceae bacterium]|nr:LTA synthase family protein [Oscillospiraceae bacterium]